MSPTINIPLRNAEGDQKVASSVDELRALTAQGYGGIVGQGGIIGGYYQMGEQAFQAETVDELLGAFERGATFATRDAARTAMHRGREEALADVHEQYGDLAVADAAVQGLSFGIAGLAQEALAPGVRETQRDINRANPELYTAGQVLSFAPALVPGALPARLLGGAAGAAGATGVARNVLQAGVRAAGTAGVGRVAGEAIRSGGTGLARRLTAGAVEAGVDTAGLTLSQMISGDRELAADAVLADGGLGAAVGFGAELGVAGLTGGLSRLASLAKRTGRSVMAGRAGETVVGDSLAHGQANAAVQQASDQEIARLFADQARSRVGLTPRVPDPQGIAAPAQLDEAAEMAFEVEDIGRTLVERQRAGGRGVTRVRGAQTGGGDNIYIADIRRSMPGMPDEVVDDALSRLADDGVIDLIREDVLPVLRRHPELDAGGLQVGDVRRHLVRFRGPRRPRPDGTPAATTGPRSLDDILREAQQSGQGGVTASAGPDGRLRIGGQGGMVPAAPGPSSPLPSIAPPQVQRRISRANQALNRISEMTGQALPDDIARISAARTDEITQVTNNIARLGRSQADGLNQIIDTMDNLRAIRGNLGRGETSAVLDLVGPEGLARGARALSDDLDNMLATLETASTGPGAVASGGLLSRAQDTLSAVKSRMAGANPEDVFFDVADAYSELRRLSSNLSDDAALAPGNTAVRAAVADLGTFIEREYGQAGVRLKEFMDGIDQYRTAMDSLRDFTRTASGGRREADARKIERALAGNSEFPEDIQAALIDAFRGAERAADVAGDFGTKLDTDVAGIAKQALQDFDNNLETIRLAQSLARQNAHEYRGVAQLFTGGAMGSVVGGTLGAFAGGPMGALAGSAAGAAMGAVLRPGMHYQRMALVGEAYKRIAGEVQPRVQGLMGQIKRVAGGAAAGATRARRAAPGLVVALNSPEDVETQYRAAQGRLRELAGNPEALQSRIEMATSLAGELDSDLGQIMGMRIANAVNYLNSVFPEDRRDPLRPNKPGPLPSRTEMGIAIRRLQIVEDPLSLLDKLADGSLTVAEADTVRQVYPVLFQEIATQVGEALVEYEGTIPFQTRTSLSSFLGIDTSRLLTSTGLYHLQSRFAQTEAQQRTINPPARPMGRSVSESTITVTQRMSQ